MKLTCLSRSWWLLVCVSASWALAEPVYHQVPALVEAAKEAPAAEVGASTVVRSELGDYRQTGPGRNDRLVYLFETDRDEDYLKLTVTYPDDQPRLAEIFLLDNAHWGMDALGTGYITGLPHPLTRTMITQSAFFHVHRTRRFMPPPCNWRRCSPGRSCPWR